VGEFWDPSLRANRARDGIARLIDIALAVPGVL